MQAGIVGMGIMERLLALALHDAGWQVTLFDQGTGDTNCSLIDTKNGRCKLHGGAKTKEHETVATALRTSITRNQSRLRVVFTGSSRTQLAHVFSNSNAPLYSTGSAIADFPQLDHNFGEYIAERFEASTSRVLPIAPAWKAFVAFKQQPEPFLVGIVDMVLNPAVTLDEAMQTVADKLALTENHEGAWAALDATQKALVCMLAQDPSLKPFSKAVVVKLRTVIGIESVEVTHVQRAMTKLANVVFKSPRDTYEFENEAFAQWVRTLAA